MSCNVSWVRMVRTIAVAALLVIALLGAVLGSVGTRGDLWNWAREPGARVAPGTPPAPGGMASWRAALTDRS
jgi:hypothetical protein